jgi:hypothetical protein
MRTSGSLHVRLFVFLILLSACARGAFAQINITTERYEQSRLGADLNETQLNTSNVNINTFGKLWSYLVSGSVYAQPLYVQNVTIPGKGTHNVLYVVTMNDVVYGFDADSNSNTPLLSVDLTTQVAGSTPVPITDIVGPGLNVVGNVGIESTPVIDLSTSTMYLVARTKESASTCGTVNGNYCQRLHALDMTTLAEKFGGPVVIQGSVSGTGNASVGGTLTFDPKIHNQRSSLALVNGQISIAWASHEDQQPYHGWVMSYDATNLQQTGMWCSSPDGFMGGVWMSGWGPAVDASGNVYYTVGNGDWNGTRNFGESMVKFGSTLGMPLLDWFTPDSWSSLNAGDVDYGSSGPILIPGTDLIAAAGKSSIFYVTHTGNLGHEQAGNGQIVQSLANNGGEVKGGPVYWNRSGGAGPWMYVWSNNCDFLKAYHFNGTTFDTGIVSEGTIASPCGASGGVLTLSANGSTAGSGIIWSSMPLAEDGDHGVHQGVLRAFNADDLTKELWNSRLNATRDDSGNWPKFSPPTVVNGRVYLASFPADGVSNAPLNVYGLLSTTPDFTISATPTSQGVNPGGSASYSVSTSSIFNFSGAVTLSVTGLPSGASASFAANNFATPGSTQLTVYTSSGTPLGTSNLTITGASGAIQHTTMVSLVVTTTTPGTGAISIDFVGHDIPMASTEVAGVLPKSNWNEAQGSSGNGLALFDETGTPTGATVSWTSSPVWSLPIADTPGNFRMMNGYLDTAGQNTTVTVTGLPANAAGYDVYLYADGDNGGATRTGTYQISGTGITTTSINLADAANTNFNGTFTQANNSAGNYVVFSIAATGFTLTAIPSTASDGTQRAPVNGMQIIPHDPQPVQPVAPPTVFIDAPTSGATVSGIVAISGWAVDNAVAVGTAISSVQVKVDGTAAGTATYGLSRSDVCTVYSGRPGCPNVGYSYSLNTSTLSPGSHTIIVTATDSDATPDSASSSVTVNVQAPPPAVWIDAPTSGATVSGIVAISGWAVDNAAAVGTAISSVQVKVDGTVAGTATYGFYRPDVCAVYPGRLGCPNVGYSFSLNTSTLSVGTHTITVTATDSDTAPDSGSSSVTVNVQPPAPTVWIDTPTSGATVSGIVVITGWAVDNAAAVGTAISSVQVKVDGTVAGTATYGLSRPHVCAVYPGRLGCPNVGYSYSLDTSTLSVGSHTITVTATDSDATPDAGSSSVTVNVGSGYSSPQSYNTTAGTWYALNRAGDYSNNDTECYNQNHVSFAPNDLVITFETTSATCGDYDHALSSHANQSGDVSLATQNFTFGDFQAKIEFAGGHSTFWLLGAHCQPSNAVTADSITYNGEACDWNSDENDSGEVDAAEIKTANGGTTTVYQNICSATSDSDSPYFGTCDAFTGSTTTTDVTSNFHVYEIKWTSSSIAWYVDGTQTNSSSTRVPQHPMFTIFNLAADPSGTASNGQQMTVQWFKHCPSSCANSSSYMDANADFSDNFTEAAAPAPPTNLTITTK